MVLAWIATGAVVLLFFALLLRRRSYRIPAIVCLIILAGAVVSAYSNAFRLQQRVRGLVESSNPDFPHSRILIWKTAIQMWREHFWFGVTMLSGDRLFQTQPTASETDRSTTCLTLGVDEELW